MVFFFMCKVTGSHFNKKPGHFNKKPGHFIKKPGNFNKKLGHFNKKPGHFNKKPGHFNKKPGHLKRNRLFLPFLPLLSPICEFLSLTINSFLRKVKAISGPLGQNSDTVPLTTQSVVLYKCKVGNCFRKDGRS